MTSPQLIALMAASVGAGVMNAVAGGGTLLTFPTLLLIGEPAIVANATSTIALLPAAAASMWGYREDVKGSRAWLRWLLLPSLLGGAIGAVLLLRTPNDVFARLAPWLILFATLLFMLQGAVSRWVGEAHGDSGTGARRWAAWLMLFGVSVYGGYFGAGIGIITLAVLGFLGLSDIHQANGLKNFFGMCTNSVAAAYFASQRAVDWPIALLMIGGSAVGGYAGARLARHVGRAKTRVAVVVIGLGIAGVLLVRQWG